jgi:hypothetical protein
MWRLIPLVMLVAAPAAAQTYPFEGRWAERRAYCGNRWGPVDIPSHVPITISARALETPLMTCRFRMVVPMSAGHRVDATCEGEGERNVESFVLTITSQGQLAWRWGRNRTVYVRCPAR